MSANLLLFHVEIACIVRMYNALQSFDIGNLDINVEPDGTCDEIALSNNMWFNKTFILIFYVY